MNQKYVAMIFLFMWFSFIFILGWSMRGCRDKQHRNAVITQELNKCQSQ